GSADFAFKVRVKIAFASFEILAFKGAASASSRFTIVENSVSNVISTAGNYTEGSFVVRASSLTASDAGSYKFEIVVNGQRYSDTTSRVVKLTIRTPEPPVITKHPLSQTIVPGEDSF